MSNMSKPNLNLNNTDNVIWNPEEIRIPPRTLVLMGGISKSGKTTFAKEMFPEKCIINIDSVLERIANKLVEEFTNEEFGIIPGTDLWENDFSEKLGKTALLKLVEEVDSMVSIRSKQNPFTVYDAVQNTIDGRIGTILRYIPYFKNIYFIVLKPELKTVQKRKKKDPKVFDTIGLSYPDDIRITQQHIWLDLQIQQKKIGICTDKTFIIEDPEKPKFVFP